MRAPKHVRKKVRSKVARAAAAGTLRTVTRAFLMGCTTLSLDDEMRSVHPAATLHSARAATDVGEHKEFLDDQPARLLSGSRWVGAASFKFFAEYPAHSLGIDVLAMSPQFTCRAGQQLPLLADTEARENLAQQIIRAHRTGDLAQPLLCEPQLLGDELAGATLI